MLNIDGTLILQIANFLVLLVVMNVILYKPIRGILAKRDEEMASRQKTIDDYQGRVKDNEDAIEIGNGVRQERRLPGKRISENTGAGRRKGSPSRGWRCCREKIDGGQTGD